MSRHAAAVLAVVVALLAVDTHAAVLCAKKRRDGTLSAKVKVREACRPFQEQVLPQDLGVSCSPATTTTTSTIDPSQCPSTSTLLAPPCGFSQSGTCFNGQQCVQTGPAKFECQGPARCGAYDYCGGECPLGQGCDQRPVPAGCGPIGCDCQSLHPDRSTTTSSTVPDQGTTTSTFGTTTTSTSSTSTSTIAVPCGSAATPACFGECPVAGTHCVYDQGAGTCGCIFTTTTTL
jgi:hypothetical protein